MQRIVGLRRPEGVVGDDQVEQAVVVVVEPGGGHAEGIRRLGADAGSLGHIGKGAISVVVIESVPAGAADEQILIAVVIVIADRHAEVEVQIFAQQARFAR